MDADVSLAGASDERSGSHVLGDLGFVVVRGAPHELVGEAAVVPEMHVPGTEVLRTSILSLWADVLTGLLAADEMSPRVPVTLQLDLDLYAPPAGVPRVRAVARRVKAGRTVFVAAVDFTEEGGRPLGSATGVFLVSPDPEVRMPEGPSPVDAMGIARGRLSVPFAERASCERLGGGSAALLRREDGLNASGTVNGGLLALVAEEAVLDARPGTTLASLSLCFLRPVRVGPAVATTTVHGDVAEVAVVDAGRDDTHAIMATARTFAAQGQAASNGV